MKALSLALVYSSKVWRRLRMLLQRPLFGRHGRNFIFDPEGMYSYENIYVGDDVSLGWRPTLVAGLSEIIIGNNVMFGPHVTIIGGGHNISAVGRYMTDVYEKTGNEDLGVEIEDDVWVGAHVLVLRGVKVGRGSVVGAGSVVTKSVPPYSIVTGNPATVLRFRWDVPTIMAHERELYPTEKQLKEHDLHRWQTEMTMLPPLRATGD